MDSEIRNTMLYLLGILALIVVIMAGLVFLGDNEGLSMLFGSDAEVKTYDQAETVIEEGVDYQAVIKTNFGDITYDLLENNAPTTVNNFIFLARDDYYDGVKFHRIVPGFIIQSGSRLSLDDNPNNDGIGGPGYTFDDEINWDTIEISEEQRQALADQGFESDPTVTSVNIEQYDLAMANSGPGEDSEGTNGSQFFITLAGLDDPSVEALQGKHTVFGRIISGGEVIEQISNVELDDPTSQSPRPLTDVIIEDVEIIAVGQDGNSVR